MSIGLPPDAAPWWQLALIVLAGPPVGAFVFKWGAQGWARFIFNSIDSEVSPSTAKLISSGFWWILAIMYAMTLGISVWVLFLR